MSALLPRLALAWALLAAPAAEAARIVAVGDVHGEIEGLEAVLQAAELVDAEGAWIGGDAVFVQTGDLTDRGPRVREVLDRMRALEAAAPARGGRVVALLGNHEISNLAHLFDEQSTPLEVYHQIWTAFADDESRARQKAAYKRWRRWQRRYPACGEAERKEWLAAHPPGFVEYVEALSPSGEYGRWLRGLPVVAEIDGNVFLHGGLSPAMVERGYDSLAGLNEAARAVLRRFDEDRQRLIDDQIITPFSTLQEMHCALVWEIGPPDSATEPAAVARRDELLRLRERLPGMPEWLLTDENGPVWFRGLAMWDETEKAAEVEQVLAAYGARRIVVGHTPGMGEIRSRFAGRVYLIDTAMAYADLGGRAAALEIVGDRVSAIYVDERVVLDGPPAAAEAAATGGGSGVLAALAGPPAAPAAAAEPPAGATPTWLGPDGEPLPFTTVDEVLDFLATAKVIEDKRIPTGITLPRRLLLERDGVRAHAIFHDVKIEKRRERLRGGEMVLFFRDHYANQVAAFELGRMLGMTNVPPAVVRRVRGRDGSVQLWIEKARTEADRRRLKVLPAGRWRLAAHDMWVFDNLIHNFDRNQGNILFDSDWNLWLIDHTRGFNRLATLPDPDRVKRCSRRLWRALHELDEEEVKRRLRPYLGIYEVKAIFGRRDLLIELIEQRIAEHGEEAVLFSYEAPPAGVEDEPEPEIPDAPPAAG